jgi:hypothetical protein
MSHYHSLWDEAIILRPSPPEVWVDEVAEEFERYTKGLRRNDPERRVRRDSVPPSRAAWRDAPYAERAVPREKKVRPRLVQGSTMYGVDAHQVLESGDPHGLPGRPAPR